MGMVVRTNMAGLNANNALNNASKTQQNAMQKLASGFRINKAADDASGLAISEKMKNQIKALDTAADNCEDGANMIQTAEGYMAETHDMINRMVELAEKAANGVLDENDRSALQDEMDQLSAEIDRIATTANFNGKKLMDGSIGSSGQLQINSVVGSEMEYVAPTGGGTSTILTGDATAASVTGGTFSAEDKNTIASQANSLAAGIGADGDAVNVYYHNTTGEVTTNDMSHDTTNYTQIKVNVSEQTVTTQAGEGIMLQIGESSTTPDRLEVSINSFHTDSLFGALDGIVNKSNDDVNVANQAAVKVNDNSDGNGGLSTYNTAKTLNIKDMDNATAAADVLRQVSNYVSDERGKLGALQNRLDHTVNNLTTASENITASNSRIRDTNMAEEMMNYTSKNVIAQAAQAMLAQANSQPQNVLSLLQ